MPARNRGKATGSNFGVGHLDFIVENRVLAQTALECIADLLDLPLVLINWPSIEEAYEKYISNNSKLRDAFRTEDDLRQFIDSAAQRPDKATKDLGRQRNAWQQVFRSLLNEVYITSPTRVDPVVHLLRRNPRWRWLETLALYDGLLRGGEWERTLKIYESRWPNLWVTDKVAIEVANKPNCAILIGPSKRDTARAISSDVFRQALVRAQSGNSASECADLDLWYEHYLNDRPVISDEDLRETVFFVESIFKQFAKLRWSADREVDRLDMIAAAELACFVAKVFAVPNVYPRRVGKRLVVEHLYPLSYSKVGSPLRVLRYEGDFGRSAGWRDQIAPSANRRKAAHDRSLVIGNPDVEQNAGDREAQLVTRFERMSRRRKSAQSQRLSEELYLLSHDLQNELGGPGEVGLKDSETASQLNEVGDSNVGNRVARAAVELCNANTGVVYRYDHYSEALRPLGLFITDTSAQTVSIADFEWMTRVADEPTKRLMSIAYRAADQTTSISYSSGSEFRTLFNSDQVLAPPEASAIPKAKSIVAVPIQVLGRLWGVFEVTAERPNAFLPSDIEALEKLAELIGPIYHEKVVITALYRMANTTSDEDALRFGIDELARAVADVFLCSSSCIWVQDLFETKKFQCAGFSGRADLEAARKNGTLPRFSDQDSKSVAIKLIRENGDWVSGEIGRPPFSGKWLTKKHTASLVQASYQHIAIAPIYDLERNAIAVISLYSRRTPFSPKWEGWANYISRYVGVVISRVHNVRDVERIAQRLSAHEIRNSITSVENSIEKIFGHLERMRRNSRIVPPIQTTEPPNLQQWLTDTMTYLDEAADRLDNLTGTGKPSSEAREEALGLLKVKERATQVPVPISDFRKEFHASFSALRKKMSDNGVSLFSKVDQELLLRMDSENLRIILANLSSNALKYSSSKTTIRCGLLGQTFSTRFYITNEGPPLAEGEPERIFQLSFRGRNARGKRQGSGLGLYIAKWICDLYDIAIEYKPVVIEPGERGGALHVFNVDFPNKLVVRRGPGR